MNTSKIKKTFNFYCDESTHLESDGQPYMVIGYVSAPFHLLKMHNKNIREMKIKHFVKGEVKWSALSKSRYPFYNEDRKSTRLNSSHVKISYAVFCLKKK